MNVKEIMSVLKTAEKVTLMYGDNCIEFRNNDAMAIDAFGKYAVNSVMAIDGETDHYCIELLMRPVVEERK